MTAANLLIEEFPLAEKYMEREDDAHWLFHTEVCKYEGIGRFVLGLFEDIEIINSPDFVLYLKEKCRISVKNSGLTYSVKTGLFLCAIIK